MNKNKIFRITMAALLIVLSIAGTSMAYFTDVEKETNVFTAGNVDIELSEAIVTNDGLGNIIKVVGAGEGRTTVVDNSTHDYGSLFPGQTIYKDPTIKNVGSEKAYVGAIISITNDDAVANPNITTILDESEIGNFITGINTTDAVVEYKSFANGQPVGVDADADEYKIYILFEDEIAKDDERELFTGVKVNEDWENDDMVNCQKLEITVQAYATQKAGFADATSAFKASFDAWRAFVTSNP